MKPIDKSNVRRKGPQYLLSSPLEESRDKITLVLDLDETLVHSSFKPCENPDYIISIEFEGKS